MAVKIRLKRMGKIRAPFYRVVVMDSRTKRDGRAIEEIGKYHPTEEPSVIQIDSERAQYWLGNGAQPTEAVAALLKITGDWQKYKGEPGTEGTLKVKAPKTPKKDLYEAALAAAGKATSDDASGATTARKRAAKKVEEAPAAEAARRRGRRRRRRGRRVAADAAGAEAADADGDPTPPRPRPPRPRPPTASRPDRARGGPRAPRDGHRRPQGRGAGPSQGPAAR